jgi:hypothetical protein
VWYGYLNLLPGGSGVVLPCLPPEASERFLMLDETIQAALLRLAEDEPTIACDLIFAHLRADSPVPPGQQELPEMIGRRQIGSANFAPAAPEVSATGVVSVYEMADGRRLLRLDEFEVTHLDDLVIWLSAARSPEELEEINNTEGQPLGALLGNVGAQNYDIAAEIDLSRYNSVVVFSEEQNYLVGYANFVFRDF